MDWDNLKVVLAIGRGGGISPAARTLGMDPATVSRRLSAIEAAMGAILFVRSRHGLTPTRAGELAIDEAGRMERRLDALGGRLRHLSGAPSGTVRVASNPWIVSELLAPSVARLAEAYPELRLRLISASKGLSLSRREVDVALWFEIPPEQSEFAIVVGEVRYAVYRPRGVAPEALRWATFWDDRAARAPMHWLKEMGAREEDILVGANDAHAVRAAIRAGGCKGAIPTRLGDGDPALERLYPDAPERVRALHAIVHPDTSNSPEIVAVLGWVRQAMAGG
jgi:DNA-binding transcriptional LysR family regulator